MATKKKATNKKASKPASKKTSATKKPTSTKATKKTTVKKKSTPKKAPKKKINKEEALAQLVEKGKNRRFVTYDEILRSFPEVESDILFLDEIYQALEGAGVVVSEGVNLLALEGEEDTSSGGLLNIKEYQRSSGSPYDSIQMYLKEIGQYP